MLRNQDKIHPDCDCGANTCLMTNPSNEYRLHYIMDVLPGEKGKRKPRINKKQKK